MGKTVGLRLASTVHDGGYRGFLYQPGTLPEASQEAVTAANAVINQSGSEECLRGKFSNAILRLSNSCDVSGHSSTACELASEIDGKESELSMGDMIATAETVLDLLGDSQTSH